MAIFFQKSFDIQNYYPEGKLEPKWTYKVITITHPHHEHRVLALPNIFLVLINLGNLNMVLELLILMHFLYIVT